MLKRRAVHKDTADVNAYTARRLREMAESFAGPVSYTHLPYVVIASGDGIYKLDYNKVLEYHIEKKADITIVCKDFEQDLSLIHI